MRSRIITLALAAIVACCGAVAQSSSPQPQSGVSKITGVWRAEMNGLPAFTLVVTDENGDLSGAVLFYLLKRADANSPYTSTPGLPEPIFNPKFDGKTLTFQVSHRRAHPPATLADPPVTFTLTPAADGKAQLVNITEGSTSEGPPITLTHSDY